jgi:cyclopropane fatty-acyl-phospholipid synthase-like methyltransferase
MSTFWDRQAQQFGRDAQEHGVLYDKTIEATAAMLSANDTVLDFGCATGEYGFGIARYVHSVQGIDLSAKMIELAKQNARERRIENIRFDQMDCLI